MSNRLFFKKIEILENPYIYQLSVLLLSDLKKVKSLISSELNLSSSETTLDICCGTGNFADLKNGKYVGFDLNKSYIIYAKNRFKNDSLKQFLVLDIDDFNFRSKYFDNVLLISVLHHFPDKYLLGLLEKVNKTAKRRIIIMEPAIETKNPISKLLIMLDRGRFIRLCQEQLALISKRLNIIKYFTFYSRFSHLRIIVCNPKN